ELDAIVLVRIVRRADHDARAGARGARQIGDRRRRHGPEQPDVHAGGAKAAFERRLEQIARNARVLADQDRARIGARPAEDAPGGPAELQAGFRRNRLFADAAADAVRAEVVALRHVIFSCGSPSPRGYILVAAPTPA